MSADRQLKVPVRVRNATRVSDLAEVPGNVALHPRAACAPVLQGICPGANPRAVVSLWRVRADRLSRELEERELLERIERDAAILAELPRMAAHFQHRIAVSRQALATLRGCRIDGKAVQR